jgi:hypothetical protein
MTYILYIWTVVALAGDHHGVSKQAMDWRPIGEYHDFAGKAQDKCENAARQLGYKLENYRCVRSK